MFRGMFRTFAARARNSHLVSRTQVEKYAGKALEDEMLMVVTFCESP